MMVRKKGPFDRIEKVVKRKRSLNSSDDISISPPKKDGNMLNDYILKLYKKRMTVDTESAVKRNCSTSNKEESFQNDSIDERNKKSHNIETPKPKTGKSAEREKSSVLVSKHSTPTFSDVAGLDEVLMDILKLFMHLREPEVFTDLGIPPVRGFLLHGPPGCGKTHLARAIAGTLSLPYIEVAATELVCGISGESESKIRDMFNEAGKSAPCILFIDEIDAVCPKRETSEKGMERRIVAQLLKCLDELNERDVSCSVMVIGATNRPDSIDPALRRGGRFATEFAIGVPNENARFKILQILCRHLKLAPEFDLKWLAHYTPGYLGADLKSLIAEAVNVCVGRISKEFINNYIEASSQTPQEGDSIADNSLLSELGCREVDSAVMYFKSGWKIPEEERRNIYFQQQDFEIALQGFIPYTKREGFATVPKVTWDDVGALENVKKALQKAILWPVKYKKKYENAGMSSTKGILLYGPKGCGKTLLAKAIANECSINFLSVKGPELLNMYLGESEKGVRQCFQRARNSAPCVIFFDEIDALCPRRSGSDTNAAANRVVNQLLSEMDGMEERKQVFVIGATNRRENIDSAMLRPGRLEKEIYVNLPSAKDRLEILKSLTKNKTQPKISDTVDLEHISSDSRCENFSGADLAYLLRAAFSEALEEHIESSNSITDENVEIHVRHFEHAFSIVKPSVSEKERKYFQQCVQIC